MLQFFLLAYMPTSVLTSDDEVYDNRKKLIYDAGT